MERLVPINDKINGCEIKFPDTVFFYRGTPTVIIKTDKDGYLIANRNPTKLNPTQIKNDFSSIVYKRKRTDEILRQSKANGGVSIFHNTSKGKPTADCS